MIEHKYKGQVFFVSESEPPARWDSYCEALLSYKSESRPKPLSGSDKVNPRLRDKDRLGDRTEALEATVGSGEDSTGTLVKTVGGKNPPKPVDAGADHRYAQGSYWEPCRRCGKEIKRTGRRGRAPTRHEECRR